MVEGMPGRDGEAGLRAHNVKRAVIRTSSDESRAESNADGIDQALLAKILTLWRVLLDQPDLDVDMDFFAAGGQSLLAARMLAEVKRLVGFRIPLAYLFSAPTPRTFVESLVLLRAEYYSQSPGPAQSTDPN